MRKPVFASILLGAFALLAPLNASVIVYDVPLSGSQSVPPNSSPGTGTALLTLDDVAQTLAVDLTFSGLLAPTTNAHIHCCAPPTANAPVVIPFIPGGFVTGATSGTFVHTFALDATQVADVLSGQAYVNVHTTQYPGGEIRGNITAATQIPEPSTLALMATALAGVAWLRRRR